MSDAVPPGRGALRALAFPGQGVSRQATIAVLESHGPHPLVLRLRDHLGVDKWDDVDFVDTRVSQPAVFVAGLAATAHIPPESTRVVFGHSLGEITALAFAGVLDHIAAFELVVARAAACDRAQKKTPGAMVAVMGLDDVRLEWIRRSAIAATGGTLEIAAINGRRQTVLSGDSETVKALIGMVTDVNGLADELPIRGAFHSPLMADAAHAFREAVERVAFTPPRTPIVSTIDVAEHETADRLPELLWRALLVPVRWLDALGLVEQMVDSALDAGPGTTLAKLARRSSTLRFDALA